MYLLTLITRLFHHLPEELSHRIALDCLNAVYSIGLLKFLSGKNHLDNRNFQNFMNIDSRKIKLGIAAGLDKDGEYIDCLSALGIGFIEVGTVTPLKQSGNPKPRLFRNKKDESLLNRLGFNNKGVDSLVENLKKRNSTIPVGVSIGKNFDTPNELAFEDYLICMEKVFKYCSYIAINISSPNTEGLRELGNKQFLDDLLSKIKEKQNQLSVSYKYVPVFLKISPDENEDDLKQICKSIVDHKIDGIICSNTSVDHNDKNGSGGLSGAPLREKSTKCLKLVKKIVGNSVRIVASGGVMSVYDYQEKLDAGADLVQIYTGFIFKGPKLIRDIRNTDSI